MATSTGALRPSGPGTEYRIARRRRRLFFTDLIWGSTEAMFEDLYGNVFVVESHKQKPPATKD